MLDAFYERIANKFYISLDIKLFFTLLSTVVNLSAYLGIAISG